MAIFTGVLWIANSLLVPETYAPVLLRIRAAKLSKLTGKVYVSKLDINKKHHTMAQQFKIALSRPWMLLFREPIVLLTLVCPLSSHTKTTFCTILKVPFHHYYE